MLSHSCTGSILQLVSFLPLFFLDFSVHLCTEDLLVEFYPIRFKIGIFVPRDTKIVVQLVGLCIIMKHFHVCFYSGVEVISGFQWCFPERFLSLVFHLLRVLYVSDLLRVLVACNIKGRI